jgi:hypothetical protein
MKIRKVPDALAESSIAIRKMISLMLDYGATTTVS